MTKSAVVKAVAMASRLALNPAGWQGDQFFEQQYGFVHFVFLRRCTGEYEVFPR